MNRKLSEEDVKARYITPAITKVGWDLHTQVRLEYYFTDGRITVRGNVTSRGKRKFVDYLLSYKSNFPLAIIEAKDNEHSIGAGLQQAIGYANALDVKYVYASNGDGFIEQNLITGEVRELTVDQFPSPEELYQRYRREMNVDDVVEKALLEPYFYTKNYKIPRYYQRIAITGNVKVESISIFSEVR